MDKRNITSPPSNGNELVMSWVERRKLGCLGFRGLFCLRFGRSFRLCRSSFLNCFTFAVDDDLDFRNQVHGQADMSSEFAKMRIGCMSICCFLTS